MLLNEYKIGKNLKQHLLLKTNKNLMHCVSTVHLAIELT